MKKWIGVDLDGTLSKTIRSKGVEVGAVIPKMRNRVKKWIEAGFVVKILTARKLTPAQLKEIRRFLSENGIGGLEIRNSKDNDMVELWDDKAIRVEKDSGDICKGCVSHEELSHDYMLQSKANIVLTEF